MPHRPPKVTQPEIARALRAAKQAGLNVRVDIWPDGRISLVPVAAPEPEPSLKQGKVAKIRNFVL